MKQARGGHYKPYSRALLSPYSSCKAGRPPAPEDFSRKSTWGCLGLVLGRLGPVLGRLGAVLRSWEGHLGQSWPSWGHLGAVLGGLGPSWARFRPSCAVLEPNKADFGPNLKSILGKFWVNFGFFFGA